MVNSKVKLVDQLPSWFSIENYDEVYGLSARDWHFELTLREEYYAAPYTGCLANRTNTLFGVLTERVSEDSRKRLESREGLLSPTMEKVAGEVVFNGLTTKTQLYRLASGIPGLGISLHIEQKGNNIKQVFHNIPSADYSPVVPVALSELEAAGQSLTQMLMRKMPSVVVNIDSRTKGEHPTPSFEMLLVNLLVSDDLLVDSFKDWLMEKRKSMIDEGFLPQSDLKKTKLKNINSQMRSWCDCGLLPYLDLMQWALLEGKKIEKSVLGDAIFPGSNQGDRASRIRQTTVKHAREIDKWIDFLPNCQ